MNINEIFESFQGEGPSIGTPSVFVRLAGCNLRCVYCDTKYTWLYSDKTLVQIQKSVPTEIWEKLGEKVYSKQKETHPMELDELVAKIMSFSAMNIVITGGEPLLQRDKILLLLNHHDLRHYKFEIETNGTLDPLEQSLLPDQVELRYNVSPKLSNSYNDYKHRIKVKVLEKFNSNNSIFKFVITEKEEINEIKEIIEVVKIAQSRVYLMPEARNQNELLKRGKKVAEIALKNNFNYSHRLHVEFYGDQRSI